jgi:unsaturated chondroitin disaccharide hydrolase
VNFKPLASSLLLAAVALAGGAKAEAETAPLIAAVTRESLDFAAAQYSRLLESLAPGSGYPRTWQDGRRVLVRPGDWTSGFFPGALWLLYESNGDPKWRDAASAFTAGLEKEKDNRGTHDLGFMLFTSYGNELRLTGDSHSREVLLAGAQSLATRFNPVVGAVKSWDRAQWAFPVIIDNMMNLELLLWAGRSGGAPGLREIAVRHADTTLRNHFRPDGSSYHLVLYDPASGRVLKRQTHQGAGDESAWARGQAWALYGYTVMYRETRRRDYLDQAEKIADFLLRHPRMPADGVPYWDFDAPRIPNEPRDASAAAIMSSALLDLATLADAETALRYATFAEGQLRSLSSPAYRAPLGQDGCFLLLHSTGHFPAHLEIDAPLIYADYYYLEALLRCRARVGR